MFNFKFCNHWHGEEQSETIFLFPFLETFQIKSDKHANKFSFLMHWLLIMMYLTSRKFTTKMLVLTNYFLTTKSI